MSKTSSKCVYQPTWRTRALTTVQILSYAQPVCVSPEDNGSRLSRADEAVGSAHIFRDVRHSFRRTKKQIHVVVADTESEIAEELSAKKYVLM